MTVIDATIGVLTGIFTIGIFIWFTIAIYIGHTKIEMLLKHFENSPGIRKWVPLKNEGLMSMILLMGAITGAAAFPTCLIKLGELSKIDLDSLPAPLRRKLARMYIILLVLTTGLLATGFFALVRKNL